MDFEDFDSRIRERTETEDCPIPKDFEEKLDHRLAALPKRKKRLDRRIVVLIAAILLLTACVSAGTVVLRQAKTYYFDTEQEAGQAADQAAQESGASTAAYGVTSGPVEDYPAQEPIDLSSLLSKEEILEHRMGGPEDSWTEMATSVNDCAKSSFYLADTLTGLSNFWPVALPDLAWLEREYTPVPGCQYYCQKEGFGEGINTSIFYSFTFSGEYQTKDGAPFSLTWMFFPKIKNPPSDSYMVDETLDKTEEYTTTDGITVTIEWRTSVNGQKQFDAEVDYGFASFQMRGAEMEGEEIYCILDHMNLSALQTYQDA